MDGEKVPGQTEKGEAPEMDGEKSGYIDGERGSAGNGRKKKCNLMRSCTFLCMWSARLMCCCARLMLLRTFNVLLCTFNVAAHV